MIALTPTQWECLLAASHGNAESFHGKTKISLLNRGLIRYESGFVPTIRGGNVLLERYPPGRIGPQRSCV